MRRAQIIITYRMANLYGPGYADTEIYDGDTEEILLEEIEALNVPGIAIDCVSVAYERK